MEESYSRIYLDAPFNEADLFALEVYLKDAGYFVEFEITPPTDEEMGGKTVALIIMAMLTVEQLQEFLHFEEVQHLKPHIEIIEPESRREEREKITGKPK